MSFREWLGSLRDLRGNHPHWPTLLGLALDQVFQNQRTIPEGYQGEVFKDRDNEVPHERQDEKWLVKTLYLHCLTNHQGILRLGDEEILLLGWEWPTQGGNAERGCRADLVGMTREGGLVVFECKDEGNGDPPLTALIEGLDYLACLMRTSNFQKILNGFDKWKSKTDKKLPDHFQEVVPRPDITPMLVVMAPQEYFGTYDRSKRGSGWRDLLAKRPQFMSQVRVEFAISDFESNQAKIIQPVPSA